MVNRKGSKIKVGSDFSGVGAFEQALIRLGLNYQTVFACDMDKFARESFIANYGEPEYYPENVYDRKIPKESLDIYMTSPPCQDFSIAGRRPKSSDKTILFLNSYEFIKVNNPRFFIFENVKGLLSHNKKNKKLKYGETFNLWLQYLGGKSINGNAVIFPYEESVPYHIYWTVLNSKDHGVPQNRERVFIVGIRDDQDNLFTWPKKESLKKKLKDVLEKDVDEKYFLSEKMIESLVSHSEKMIEKGNAINARCFKMGLDDNYLKIKSATKQGFELAKEGDSINFSVPNSETRRVRVGKGVSQTLDTACNQAVWIGDYRSDEGLRIRKDDARTCIMASIKDDYDEKFTAGNAPITNYNERIRRLTPRECFRLQDFPDSFKFVVSDSQLYKQAGNSITVGVLAKIIEKLNL